MNSEELRGTPRNSEELRGDLGGAVGVVAGVGIVLAVCALLYRAARAADLPTDAETVEASLEAK